MELTLFLNSSKSYVQLYFTIDKMDVVSTKKPPIKMV